MENIFKVYKYTSPSGKVYIGQTCQTLLERSRLDGSGYKKSVGFYNAIKKYGFDNFSKEVLKDNLTSDEANYWEQHYIKKYHAMDKNYGYNCCEGGNHGLWSDEVKKKMSESHKGKKLSEQHKINLAKSRIGQKRQFTEYHKNHLKEAAKLRGFSKPQPVICIETKIKYNSRNEAARSLNIQQWEIGKCLSNPNRTAGGYHWEKED